MQADLKLLRSMIESFVVEFDLEKVEELISSGPISPKLMQQYRKVSSESRSQVSLETSKKKAHTLFDKASGSISLELLTTPRGANMACHVSQETRKVNVLAHGQHSGRGQSHRQTPPKAQQTQFARGLQ